MSLSSEMAQAASKDWFVTVSGTGITCNQTSPCPLGMALAGASDGDTIDLAGGTYTGISTDTEVIAVTENVTILGGWDGASSGAVVINRAGSSAESFDSWSSWAVVRGIPRS